MLKKLCIYSPLVRAAVLVVTCVYLSAASVGEPSKAATGSPYRPKDPLNDSAFNRFYNLDFDRAVAEFEKIADKYPDDAFAANHLLTAVMFQELYRMGALNSGEYANDSFISAPHRAADPQVKARIKQLAQHALGMEEKLLAANPNDVDALYARGVTRAQFATYTALMEHAWFSALRNAVGARRDHEKVLQLAPAYADAKLVVGAHNYVLGSLPWAVKVAASMVGLGGSKQKGIQYLEQCAKAGGEASIDAKVVLMLFLRREKKFDEAQQIDRELEADFPQSSLLALEQANLHRAMGNSDAAIAGYRKIWQTGREGRYPNQHYETAAMSLGDVLRGRKDYAGAAAAYELVNLVPHPYEDVKQKANLSAGELYDLLQKRELAVKKYQEVIAVNSGNEPAAAARKFIKEAYRE